MAVGLKELSANLENDLQEYLRTGRGVHIGSAVVGDMGRAGARLLTAIGDPVDTSSRLETMNKGFTSKLIVSENPLTPGWIYRRKAG